MNTSEGTLLQPNWLYTKPAFGRTGRSLSENNFAKEKRDWVAILLREVLQNGLDARINDSAPVVVKISDVRVVDGDQPFLKTLLPEEHLARFKNSVPHLASIEPNLDRFLVIEDFGTSGLIGRTDAPDLDGKGQNWNAFWFREGEGGKEHGSGNGGAGQGKITYFSTSCVRTIFAYTVRADDKKEALYGASSFLREYEFNNIKWLRDAYWGISTHHEDGLIAIPSSESDAIDLFRRKVGITRQAGETGLSLVIPAPKEFDSNHAVQVVIAEFFAPIIRGDLVVIIAGVHIDQTTVNELADHVLSDGRARELHTCTTKAYRSFFARALEKTRDGEVAAVKSIAQINQLADECFDQEELARLRSALSSGEQIAVRFSFDIKPQKGHPVTCHFDVHLMCPDDLDQPEQAVLRRDLLIGEEPIGGGGLRQRARGLTVIEDKNLSMLLLSAEEPTHLRWNAQLPRLKEYYKSGGVAVSFVRNAMAKLLDVLTAGDKNRDFRLLAKYFAAPGTASTLPAKGKKDQKGKQQVEPRDIPPPQPKKIKLEPLDDGCRVSANSSYPFLAAEFPVEASLEFAYEGLDKDAFSEYDPLDFDVAEKLFSFDSTNCDITLKELNTIEFRIDQPDFELVVRGFDKNLRLRVRLNYKEACNATVIDAE